MAKQVIVSLGPVGGMGRTKTEAKAELEIELLKVLDRVENVPAPLRGPAGHSVQWIVPRVEVSDVSWVYLRGPEHGNPVRCFAPWRGRQDWLERVVPDVVRYDVCADTTAEQIDTWLGWASRLGCGEPKLAAELRADVFACRMTRVLTERGVLPFVAHGIALDAPHLTAEEKALRVSALAEVEQRWPETS